MSFAREGEGRKYFVENLHGTTYGHGIFTRYGNPGTRVEVSRLFLERNLSSQLVTDHAVGARSNFISTSSCDDLLTG